MLARLHTTLAAAAVFTALCALAQTPYSNPVVASSFADPSLIRVGSEYWATATGSRGGAVFPLMHSTDLVHWEPAGGIFAERPAWSVSHFWAPEISVWKGRYYVYYTAKKKDGPLCVAVATADKPAGPYQDHGPLVCQEAGSIDAMAVDDENGQRYLIWKEDGNSRRLPTPLWAQPLSADGLQLTGKPVELFRNDKPWEGGVVEGPFVLRRGEYFYLFYSGNGCCSVNCTYALGVARSKRLLGPWEKYAGNPLIAGTEAWKCPGHGSIVTTPSGRYFLMYHAFSGADRKRGRMAMLDEVVFGADLWPSINAGKGVSAQGIVR